MPTQTFNLDHDRLFKELIGTFFIEFVELFLPDVSAYLDKNASIVPLDKEVFTDVTSGDKHEADLVMRVKFRGEDAFFLIHLENQASAQSDFALRMFRYFARLHEKYKLPIYPVVIFSYDAPKRPEPTRYTVAFPGKTVLQFNYTVIQLNRLPWRRFVNQHNPVATALMAKMKMSERDRPLVKVQCLRLLATLKLNPAKAKLIGGFVDSYLKLTDAEMKRYEREMATIAIGEKEQVMDIITSWERKGMEIGKEEGRQIGLEIGRQEGRQEGKETLLLRQLQRRFGPLSETVKQSLARLSAEQMDDLAEAFVDMSSVQQVEDWLKR